MTLNAAEIEAFTSSGKDDWETPWPLFEKYNEEFGFTLDVCASDHNAKCKRYFTEAVDGLAQDWSRDVCWMNPPYSKTEIGKWMKKAYEESLRGATVVCLVASRTDTKWWHNYAEKGEVRFIKGRVKFVGAKTGALFPSAIVIFRPPQSNQVRPMCERCEAGGVPDGAGLHQGNVLCPTRPTTTGAPDR